MGNGILTFGCNAVNNFQCFSLSFEKNYKSTNTFRYSKFSCFNVLYDEFLKAVALMPFKTNGGCSNGEMCLEVSHQAYFPNCNCNLNDI